MTDFKFAVSLDTMRGDIHRLALFGPILAVDGEGAMLRLRNTDLRTSTRWQKRLWKSLALKAELGSIDGHRHRRSRVNPSPVSISL